MHPIVTLLPNVSVVRIRRDRRSTALSYVEEGKIPCSGTGMFVLCPFWHVVIINPTQSQWKKLTKFQKCLWLVDEVEARWQVFRKDHPRVLRHELNWTTTETILAKREVIADILTRVSRSREPIAPSAVPAANNRHHTNSSSELHKKFLDRADTEIANYAIIMNYSSWQKAMVAQQQF